MANSEQRGFMSMIGDSKMHLNKRSNVYLSKRGNIYVEASMVMPVTFIITLSLIGILLTFHSQLLKEVDKHSDEAAAWSEEKESAYVRRWDGVEGVFQ